MISQISALFLFSGILLCLPGCSEKTVVKDDSISTTYKAPEPGQILFLNFTIYENDVKDSVKIGPMNLVAGDFVPPVETPLSHGDLVVELLNSTDKILTSVRVQNPLDVRVESFMMKDSDVSKSTRLDSASFFIRTKYKKDINKVRIMKNDTTGSLQKIYQSNIPEQ